MKQPVKVFKFGGASVKDAPSIRNIKQILDRYANDSIIVVVSAMGKTTNLLEKIMNAYWHKSEDLEIALTELVDFHNAIIKNLEIENQDFINEVNEIYGQLKARLEAEMSESFAFNYDQIVSFGEVLSTKIINAYLRQEGISSCWLDAREIIRTDHTYQEGRINWEVTKTNYDKKLPVLLSEYNFIITQGFIGQNSDGMTTTLGREGSDFTASIFAFNGQAEDVTIWKDVPGMLNADPKHFDGTVLLKKISFTEAVELAYYGASVIHPKTIQPLKNKDIPLYI